VRAGFVNLERQGFAPRYSPGAVDRHDFEIRREHISGRDLDCETAIVSRPTLDRHRVTTDTSRLAMLAGQPSAHATHA
jgi:hypothetical protein